MVQIVAVAVLAAAVAAGGIGTPDTRELRMSPANAKGGPKAELEEYRSLLADDGGEAEALGESTDNPVSYTKLKNVAVRTKDMVDFAVTSAKLEDGAVISAKLADEAVTTHAIADGAVTESKLSFDAVTSDELAAVEGKADAAQASADQARLDALAVKARIDGLATSGASDTVHWDNITDVPSDLGGGGTAADLDCVGCIEGSEQGFDGSFSAQGHIAFRSITAHELADSSVGSAEIQDGAVTGEAEPFPGAIGKIALETITAANLAEGSVGASELADGAVDTGAIQDGAVVPEKVTANADMRAPGDAAYGSGSHDIATVSLTIGSHDSPDHEVLVTGQFQLDCRSGIGFDCDDDAVVTWQLVRDASIPVGPLYSAEVAASEANVFGSISLLDTADPGDHTYSLRLSVMPRNEGSGLFKQVTVRSLVLTAVDLGRWR